MCLVKKKEGRSVVRSSLTVTWKYEEKDFQYVVCKEGCLWKDWRFVRGLLYVTQIIHIKILLVIQSGVKLENAINLLQLKFVQ